VPLPQSSDKARTREYGFTHTGQLDSALKKHGIRRKTQGSAIGGTAAGSAAAATWSLR
jgi:hypothetical protein